jgi:phosphate transport system substrate-binding protein
MPDRVAGDLTRTDMQEPGWEAVMQIERPRGLGMSVGCCRGPWATLLSLFLTVLSAWPALAFEIRLQLKGGGFEISGELESYDGQRYVIASPVFGRMTVEGKRFDCLGDNCPTGPVRPASHSFRGPITGEIGIAGSNTIGNALMPALIEGLAERSGLEAVRIKGENPLDLTINLNNSNGQQLASAYISRHGSSTAFKELEAGKAQIGMASRRVKPEEVARLAAAGLGDMTKSTHEHVLGLDGLMVIVSPDNPAVSLSVESIARIFAGEIVDWAQVGLPAGPIDVYAPAEASGTYDTFMSLVLKPRNLKLTPNAKRTENHAQQSDWVASDPNAIGFVGIAYQRNAKALNLKSTCGLISRPTRFAVKTEEYPLTRRLYLYTAGTPKVPLASGLLDFALSEEAQEIVLRNDFIDQKPDTLDFKAQAARIAYALNAADEDFDLQAMRELITDISQAERLTTTLRFEGGSFNLDAKSARDVARLARLLKQPEFKDKSVLLLGFADSVGSYAPNLRLSRLRAETVAKALSAAGYAGAVAKGYSELAPIACNDTAESREFNRRVEVWLK